MTPARRPATTNWASCRQRRVIPARRRGGEWHVRIDDVDTAVEQHEICPDRRHRPMTCAAAHGRINTNADRVVRNRRKSVRVP